MKRFIFAVAVVMACLFTVGGAFAYEYADHVTVAPNGKGDVLIYPVYLASEGLETKITVINTSMTHSVVAKLIVRSSVFSEELLDFLIYLSPTDMWIGTLKNNKNKQPAMFSTDKSSPVELINISTPQTAGEIPTGKVLENPSCISSDTNLFGYVEIIESCSTDTLGSPPVAKDTIKGWYDALPANVTFSAADTVNSLSGSYMVSVPLADWEATDNAVVLKDYDNSGKLVPGLYTLLAQNARNKIHEVDAALNKDLIAMTYNTNANDGSTLHAFTFPTKLSYVSSCSRGSDSPYFPSDGKVLYHMRVWDNEEVTTTNPDDPFSPSDKPVVLTMDDELNFKSPYKNLKTYEVFFNFGWMQYSFDKKFTSSTNKKDQVLSYTGTPVIPVVIDTNYGLSIRTAAWTDGSVADADGNKIEGYQYSSVYVVTK